MMRRRERPTEHVVPVELARVDPDDWQGCPPDEETAWYEARAAWPGDLPDPPEWPDPPFHPEDV